MLIYENSDLAASEPRTHALIIGVSDYYYLPKVGEPAQEQSYNLRSLTACCSSALKTLAFLLRRRDKIEPRLGSVRLLMSPAGDETIQEDLQDLLTGEARTALSTLREDGSASQLAATRNNIEEACYLLRDSAQARKDDATWFTFIGHGIGHRETEILLLPADFNHPDDYSRVRKDSGIQRAISFKNVFSAFEPTASQPHIARQQLYFLDCCRNLNSGLQKKISLTVPHFFELEPPKDGLDGPRNASVYTATLHGDTALEESYTETVFTRAVIDCLENCAGEGYWKGESVPIDWRVTRNTLITALDRYYTDLPGNLIGERKTSCDGGWDRPIHRLDGPVHSHLSISIAPTIAHTWSTVSIHHHALEETEIFPAPLHQHPLRHKVPIGDKRVQADLTSDRDLEDTLDRYGIRSLAREVQIRAFPREWPIKLDFSSAPS